MKLATRTTHWQPRCFSLGLVVSAAATCLPARAAEPGAASLKPIAKETWDAAKAAHLLARAGFGGTPAEVERLVTLGLDGAVDSLVDFQSTSYDPAPPPIPAELSERADRGLVRSMTEEERQKYQEQRRRMERRAFEETRLWWIERMASSPRPFEEKMTLFWHGHFTSGMREVRNPVFIKEQNEFLRDHALGNFRELVLGISKDRAMLIYLDGVRNNKQEPNENYARELMELFTLGVGHYSEDDIKNAARAFTGWAFDEDGFVFRGRNHDFGPKKFLGRGGRLNGDDVVDIILAQPACSRFLAANLLQFFCQPEPPRALVEALAGEIRRQKFELRPVMKALFKSQAFYHPESRGCLVKSPVELVVGTARRLGVELNNLVAVERAMAGMGQELMQPPNVKGWDGGAKWINTATLFNRYNTVGVLINGGGDGPAREGMRERARRRGREDKRASAAAGSDAAAMEADGGEQAMEMKADNAATNDEEAPGSESMAGEAGPKSRIESISRQTAWDPMPLVRENKLTSAAQIVDYFANSLLTVKLEEGERTSLVDYLANEGKFNVNGKAAADRIRTVVHLMCSTPEFQMN